MRTPSLGALALLLLVPSCTRGSGVKASDVRSVSEFSAVDIGGPITATVKVGAATRVEVEGDDNLLSKVETRVEGDTLHVTFEGSVMTSVPMQVQIETPALHELEAGGASTVTAEGLTGERFEVEVEGASTAKLTGQVAALSADVSGASKLRAGALVATSADVEASGASKAEVKVTESLEAEASGASTIRYHGGPGSVAKDVSGASTIEPAG